MSEGKKIRWTIASARQDLPTLVTLAAREPQDIYRRDTLVARVVGVDATPPRFKPSAAELLADLQRACAEENYTLELPPRIDRPNPLASTRKSTRRRKTKKQR